MPTLKYPFGEYNFTTATVAEKLAQYWRSRLEAECPQQSVASKESIIRWLLGSDLKRFDLLHSKDLDIAVQLMEYHYRILHQRYLGKEREAAYRNLIIRLGSAVTQRNKIQTWVAMSRDCPLGGSLWEHRQRTMLDVLQEVLQEILQSDSYMQQQMVCISKLTTDTQLRNLLLFASLEEYCLRPIRNLPLLVYRFVKYLYHTQHNSLTQVLRNDLLPFDL
ncbi:MAG: hypothetical protein KME30_27700 [Iphinoe sp. HA4291-MV1]|jgi:hypothetical protein|nr:hypothetical protein [Iphinoe sp. HA4291-MV1]